MEDDARRRRGLETAGKLFGPDMTAPVDDPFIAMTIDHVFGDVWTRPGLTMRERSMASCAVLVALGRERELKAHLNGALNLGISAETLGELMIHVAHYAGWPTGLSARAMLQEVLRTRGAKGVSEG